MILALELQGTLPSFSQLLLFVKMEKKGKYKVLGYVVIAVRVKEDKVYTEAPTILHIWDSVDIVMKIHVLLLFH